VNYFSIFLGQINLKKKVVLGIIARTKYDNEYWMDCKGPKLQHITESSIG